MKLPRIPAPPRLAGRLLLAVARAMRTPVLADALAGRLLEQLGLGALRGLRAASHAPALRFRAGPRRRGKAPGADR